MYKELDFLMYKHEIPKSELAKYLKIGYNTFLLKLNGKSKFTLDEALAIVEYFNSRFELTVTVESLFKVEPKAS